MTKTNLVILDANFILVPIQFKIDIYDDIRNLITGKIKLIIVSAVLNEIKRKIERENQSKKFKQEAEKSIELLLFKMNESPSLFMEIDRDKQPGVSVDDLLIRIGVELKDDAKGVFIASNDKMLKQKANMKGIQTLCMHQKKYIGY